MTSLWIAELQDNIKNKNYSNETDNGELLTDANRQQERSVCTERHGCGVTYFDVFGVGSKCFTPFRLAGFGRFGLTFGGVTACESDSDTLTSVHRGHSYLIFNICNHIDSLPVGHIHTVFSQRHHRLPATHPLSQQ